MHWRKQKLRSITFPTVRLCNPLALPDAVSIAAPTLVSILHSSNFTPSTKIAQWNVVLALPVQLRLKLISYTPVVLAASVLNPIAILICPIVLETNAEVPIAILLVPVVFVHNA